MMGVNTRAELADRRGRGPAPDPRGPHAGRRHVVDPASTWVDADVEIAADARIEPGTSLRGRTEVGGGSIVGPLSTLIDAAPRRGRRRAALLPGRVRRRSTAAGVGPFAYLRPGAELAAGAKAGSFVEIKNSQIGEGAKVPHLSYVGDAEVGAGSNLGAGTITANYDGFRKHRTVIGDQVRIGVDTMLIAPVEVGDSAYTGAGAVIKDDVPEGALAVSENEQRNIEGYAERKAAGCERRTTREHDRGAKPRDGCGGNRDRARLLEADDGLRRPQLDGARRQGRRQARPRPRPGDAEDLRQRRGLLPLRGVDPRRRRLPRPVDLRQRAERDDPQRRAGRAADDDRRRPGRLGPPDHRRHALVRLRPPGQEVGAARADLGPDRRQMPRGRRRRPRPDDGPPRRPGPGLLPRPGRPHDGDADADPVVRRPEHDRRAGDRLPRRGPGEDGAQLRPPGRHPLGGDGEGASRPSRSPRSATWSATSRARPRSSSTT